MRNIKTLIVTSIFLSLCFISCSNDSKIEQQELLIQEISPISGKVGDEISIKYSGLSENINSATVKLNNIEARITQSNTNQLFFIVPNTDSGKIELNINDEFVVSNDDFLIERDFLKIEEISPEGAEIGQEIVIKFSGVSDSINNYSVWFNNKESEVKEISPGELTCIVPPYSRNGKIELRINDQNVYSDTNFVVNLRNYPRRYSFGLGSFVNGGFNLNSIYYDVNENDFKFETHAVLSNRYWDRLDKVVYNKSYNQFVGFTDDCQQNGYRTYNGNDSRWGGRETSCGGGRSFITVFVDTNQNKTFSIYTDDDAYLVEIGSSGSTHNNNQYISKVRIEDLYNNLDDFPHFRNEIFIDSQSSLFFISNTRDNNYNILLASSKINTTTFKYKQELIINNTGVSDSDLISQHYNWKPLYDKTNNRLFILGDNSDNFFELSLNDNTLTKINTSGVFIEEFRSYTIYNNQIIFGINGYTMDMSSFNIEKIQATVRGNNDYYFGSSAGYMTVD